MSKLIPTIFRRIMLRARNLKRWKRAQKLEAQPSSAIVASALARSIRQRPLRGVEIAQARISGARSTGTTLKRYRTWARKEATPSHVGRKQLSKGACGAY